MSAARPFVVTADRFDGRRVVFSRCESKVDAERLAAQLRSHGMPASIEDVTAIADPTPGAEIRRIAA